MNCLNQSNRNIISTIYILTTKIDKPYKENKFNKPAQ